jgi:hypothetical protein
MRFARAEKPELQAHPIRFQPANNTVKRELTFLAGQDRHDDDLIAEGRGSGRLDEHSADRNVFPDAVRESLFDLSPKHEGLVHGRAFEATLFGHVQILNASTIAPDLRVARNASAER